MNTAEIKGGKLLWEPSKETKKQANMTRYLSWLRDKRGLDFESYHQLWKWSVDNLEGFWASLWDYFEIKTSKPYTEVLSKGKMPDHRWFLGAELNYTEHVFRKMTDSRPALLFQSEGSAIREVTWQELYESVSSVADRLRNMGIKAGDRVVAYMPNIPETVVAFLATASLGAIWSSWSPDFGSRSVIDRFKQIEPKVLFATDGYTYSGRKFDRRPIVAEIKDSLESLEATIMVANLYQTDKSSERSDEIMWQDIVKKKSGKLLFEQVSFNHPMWIVYSSGTTGLPKALVQSQGGILLEQMKFLGLQFDAGSEDRVFWFTTTGWIMWNILISSLLLGSTAILFDGNPAYPDMEVLWRLAQSTKMTVLGTGAPFLISCMRARLDPANKFDLDHLKVLGSTGSPLSPEGFQWVYQHVKKDILLGSTSGGTDVCTGFLGPCPLLPVRAGEIQCRCLGVKAEAFDEQGNAVIGQVGELVITKPMPSMPLFLWNDPNGQRYNESYFDIYPGVWRHGDWIKITSEGSAVIYGRSDSTLKRMGVRMGSSEIYSVVEDLEEVEDSLIIGYELSNDKYFMPLFVVLKEDIKLDDALKEKINKKIRETLTPRHVPDDIFVVAAIPKTLNNKKLEVPVKKILMGIPIEKAVNLDSMINPECLLQFVELHRTFSK
jgi:acetoacetyl-CoA synthetase